MESPKSTDPQEQLSQFIQAANTFENTSNSIISTLAKAIKQQPQKQLSEADLQRIKGIVSAEIASNAFKKGTPPSYTAMVKERREEKHDYLLLTLLFIVFIVIISFPIAVLAYYRSDAYLGKQFYEVFTSEYLTKEEWEGMKQHLEIQSVLPANFHDDPEAAITQLKNNKAILKKRKKEAKKNKGKFSTEEAIQ